MALNTARAASYPWSPGTSSSPRKRDFYWRTAAGEAIMSVLLLL
jgi:hypothetical protein